jgi:hypothetical protein
MFSVLSYAVLTVGGLWLIVGAGSPFLRALVTMGALHQALQTSLMARMYALSRSDRRYLVFRPLAVAIVLFIIARTVLMCRTHRVHWRGDAYGKELQETNKTASV